MERSVMAIYGNNRIWRVDAVRFDMTPQSTFKDDDGKEHKFIDYFDTTYGQELKKKNCPVDKIDKKQPMLMSIM